MRRRVNKDDIAKCVFGFVLFLCLLAVAGTDELADQPTARERKERLNKERDERATMTLITTQWRK